MFPKWNTEIPNQLKYFSSEPKRNGVQNVMDNNGAKWFLHSRYEVRI